MEIFFGVILASMFLYINFLIIKKDVQEKIIPNKYLVYLLILLPFWYVYGGCYGYFGEIHFIYFGIECIILLFFSFLLFYTGIWGAGDAKYMLVLGFFIPYINLLSFLTNIACTTILYSLVFFLYFWIGKIFWKKEERYNFYRNIWNIKKSEFFLKNIGLNKREIYFQILKSLIVFLVLFLSIKLVKLYILESLFYSEMTGYLLYKYGIYFIILCFTLIVFLIFILRFIYLFIVKLFANSLIIELSLILVLSSILILFLLYEYSIDPIGIYKKLIIILSFYLLIHIGIKLTLIFYKLTFKVNEEILIPIEEIKEGMIIDKKWFDIILKRDADIFGDIKIQSKILNAQDIEIIKYVIEKVNERENIKFIPTYKTISFGIFIFVGFGVSFFFNSLIEKFFLYLYQITIL